MKIRLRFPQKIVVFCEDNGIEVIFDQNDDRQHLYASLHCIPLSEVYAEIQDSMI